MNAEPGPLEQMSAGKTFSRKEGKPIGSVRIGLFCLSFWLAGMGSGAGAIRDGGVDPGNLGKGEWVEYVYEATNYLGWVIASVTNENSLMLYYKTQGTRYVVVKAGQNDQLYNGYFSAPQFTSNLVNAAHQNGILIFGYSRSYGSNITAEIAIADYVFQQGADGYVWEAREDWENTQPWILNGGPAKAWELCSTVRGRWPNKFLAYAPTPIISMHSSFPYKEFGYWCDAVMPQIYAQDWKSIYGRPSGGINWSDANWANFHKTLQSMPPTNINGTTVRWNEAIKPLAPVNFVVEGSVPDEFVTEFVDYLNVDPHGPAEGYKGASFWVSEWHSLVQWTNIGRATIGTFPGVVNNLVFDDTSTTNDGSWTAVRTFYCSANLKSAMFAGSGSGTDTNSFGTNYLVKPRGFGTNSIDFRFNVKAAGDYQVWEWHPYRTDAGTVPFEITHGRGTTTVNANQKTNSGKWSLLGKFSFYPDTPALVRVRDDVVQAGTVALVDGLKLSFVYPASIPTYPIRGAASALSTSEMNVGWTDTATNTAMFVVGRAPGTNGPFVDVGAVGGHLTQFVDRGLLPNTTYYYVVRATNVLGASAASKVFSGTTLAATPVVAFGDQWWGQTFPPAVCTGVVAVAAGDWHSSALRSDGRVVCWGDNVQGQCDVPPELTDAVAISAGAYHNLAIRANGTVVGWGDGNAVPSATVAGLRDVVGIACGSWHNLALRGDGTVVAWGNNSWGQCTVPAGVNNITAVAAGGSHSVALRADGTVFAWGENLNSEGNFAGQSVVPAGLSNVIAIAAGKYHTLALKANGMVLGFGENGHGQCVPPASATNVVAIAAGGAHSLALRADGRVIAWGDDWSGQCSVPTTSSNVVALAAGEKHTLLVPRGTVPDSSLHNPVFRAARFRGVVQTLNRTSYALEYSDSLGTGAWTSLPAVPGNGALRVLTDNNAASTQRFYRVRQW